MAELNVNEITRVIDALRENKEELNKTIDECKSDLSERGYEGTMIPAGVCEAGLNQNYNGRIFDLKKRANELLKELTKHDVRKACLAGNWARSTIYRVKRFSLNNTLYEECVYEASAKETVDSIAKKFNIPSYLIAHQEDMLTGEENRRVILRIPIPVVKGNTI